MSESRAIERRLFEACLSGSVSVLDSLIEEDQLILNQVNLFTDFFNGFTPLHVAASCGHLDLTKALLARKPKLASELDSKRCSPLHLASTEGHFEIVQELLRVNKEVCLIREQYGRTPLHLAAVKGQVEVIKELLQAKPESIHEKLSSEETVLHLCVKYNKLEALKTLVENLRDNDLLLSAGNQDGNTILHLAVALKQIDTIKYLLGIKSVREHCANVKNRNNFIASEVVDHCPNIGLKTMEIRELFQQLDVRMSIYGGSNLNPESQPNDYNNPPPPPPHCGRNQVKLIVQYISRFWTKFLAVDHLWLKEVRGHLITAATLTATMAYQAILSPPGGFWQENKVGNKTEKAAPPTGFLLGGNNFWGHKAGEAILDSKDEVFSLFIGVNSLVLFASLCTIMLALSGLPYTNKLFVWLMIFTVYITLSCLAIAYVLAINSIFPKQVEMNDHNDLLYGVTYTWGFVLVLHSCHFLVWLVKKLIQGSRCLVYLVKKFAKLVGRQPGPNNYIP